MCFEKKNTTYFYIIHSKFTATVTLYYTFKGPINEMGLVFQAWCYCILFENPSFSQRLSCFSIPALSSDLNKIFKLSKSTTIRLRFTMSLKHYIDKTCLQLVLFHTLYAQTVLLCEASVQPTSSYYDTAPKQNSTNKRINSAQIILGRVDYKKYLKVYTKNRNSWGDN